MARRELRTHIDKPYEDKHVCLHFVGDMLCARQSEIGFHRNPGFEICLIPSGKGLFRIDDAVFPVENDQLFLTKSHQVHGGWPSAEAPFRILYLCVAIKGGVDCEDPLWAEVHRRLSEVPFPVCADHQELAAIHNQLMREASGEGGDRAQILQALLRLFLLKYLRNVDRTASVPASERGAADVIRYIDARLRQELRLADIAAAHHQSVSALTRRFRRETGFSVMEYCHMARLERAKGQLAETDLTVSDIAASWRFGSIHHFSHAFKAAYGVSPSVFRKHRRDGADSANPRASCAKTPPRSER